MIAKTPESGAPAPQAAGETPAPEPAGADPSPSAPPTSAPPTSAPPAAPSPAPTCKQVAAAALGEWVSTSSASIRINKVEVVPSGVIEGEYATIEAAEGHSLHLIELEWTNLSAEAATSICLGPSGVSLSVFDEDNQEMLEADRVHRIPGNDCGRGLLTGETGPWITAFEGAADATPAFAVIDAWRDDETAAVALLPDVELCES
ncbi:MAG: hypothetical protein LBG60_00800 [Bifidobacteriaceae bacterium]|jgi:hypothetical protein|nr:hypothetical protein [Bifidobacteriaceae bacterium]